MYEYRKLTPEQQAQLVQERLSRGYPAHSPPHLVRDKSFYLLTAACYEHQHYMNAESRRQELLNMIFESFTQADITILAWVILPNHYHILVHIFNFDVLSGLFRRLHGVTSRQWNREENLTHRKIWYSWSDRAIRSQEHYYRTLNYIHYNPVKHGFVELPYHWQHSSVHWYFESYGREWLRDTWTEYPVRNYGDDWDI
jgi:putative transposase